MDLYARLLYLILAALQLRRTAAPKPPFPYGFSDLDIDQYTVRYVSPDGQDSEECLRSQPYPPPSGDCGRGMGARHCKTIGYGLLGTCVGKDFNNCTSNITSNLITLFYPGSYSYGEISVVLRYYTNVVIRKVPSCQDEVVFSCHNATESILHNNLYFLSSTNIAVDGVVFTGCGPFSPGAGMFNVTNATFTNSEFRGNLNSGFVAYTSYDTVFHNCTFKNNTCTLQYNESDFLTSGSVRYAGGLTLEWRDQPEPPVTVLIKNCTFVNNTAGVHQDNMEDAKRRPNFYTPRGHGGAILVSLSGTSDHTILIEDSFIISNTAEFSGGGIFISMYNQAYTNRIVITGTVFEGNICKKVGGGISMNAFDGAEANRLIVASSEFTDNVAGTGGGAYTIIIQDVHGPNVSESPHSVIDNVGVFTNCTFRRNFSPEGGSAVSLVSNARVDQVSAPVIFTDCDFLYNKAVKNRDGTIMAFRFPVSLKGTTIFRGNIGGGVSLLQSHLNNYGHTIFEDNDSESGGGMELRDLSVIQLFNGTRMEFVNNSASWGGGISVRSASVGIDTDIIRLFNTRCFLQYEIENTAAHLRPSEWNVTLAFRDNTASKDGAAIYATDVERCTYAPSHNENISTPTNSYTRSIFNLQPGIFQFVGNEVLYPNGTVQSRAVHDVATAPSWFKVEPKYLEAGPGEIVSFTISAVDESNNWQMAVWSVHEEDEATVEEEYFSLAMGPHIFEYVICSRSTNCEPGTTKVLRFSLVQIIAASVSNVTDVSVMVRGCYPGYRQQGNQCLVNRTSGLILRSDRNNKYVYIRRQFYAAYNTTGAGLVVHGIIPIPFQNCTEGLSGCLFEYDDPDKQCSEGRHGFLCGRCLDGDGVDLTLIRCCNATVQDTIVVAIVVVLFVVTCAVILIFNIGIPNDLRGCLFFIQVVGFVYQYREGELQATWDFHLSGVFGSSLYLPLCPKPSTNALYTTAYGLLLPVSAIITIIVYIISARFIKHLSNKNSFDGIWFLTFVIYKFTADTCFSVLRCQKVDSEYRQIDSDLHYYYNGSVRCFSTEEPEHLYFAVVALVIGVVVLLFPALVLLISFRRFKLTQQLTDVLNNDLKTSCRWWGSFDLLRRLLFIIVVLTFSYTVPLYTQIALLFSGLFVFFVFACTRPYNSTRANIIEGLVQLDLLVLTSLFLDTARQKQGALRPFANILLLAPFIFMFLYISAMCFGYAWKRYSPFTARSIFTKQRRKFFDLTESGVSDGAGEFTNETLLDSNVVSDNGELHSEYSKYREELLNED